MQIFIFFAGVALGLASQAACPTGWQSAEGSPLCFAPTTTQTNWIDAPSACEALATNATLASFTTDAEATTVRQGCGNQLPSTQAFWVGLNDNNQESVVKTRPAGSAAARTTGWEWYNEADTEYIFSEAGQALWASTQPNNYFGENCVIVKATSRTLDDVACASLTYPSCCSMIPPSSSPTPSTSVSPSITPSTSTSASQTPSTSASASPTPSVSTSSSLTPSSSASTSTSPSTSSSPSGSPSVSVSVSASLTNSPSTSVSASISPSQTASSSPSSTRTSSPSTSASVSRSVSSSVSISPSITPSSSVSSSISPSSTVTPSISSSTSTSPSITPSTSTSPSISPSSSISSTSSPSISASITISPSITPTITPSNSASPTVSSTPTTTPAASPEYTKMADSQMDFTRANPNNGWSYGYYYRTSAVRSLYSNNDWSASISGYMYAASYARITASTLHPNAAAECSTPSYGLIKPSIAWQNEEMEERGYYRIEYSASHAHGCGDGITLTLLIDGQQAAYNTNPTGTISRSDVFIRESIQSLELILDPRSGCNCDQTTYRIQIYGYQPSASPSPTPSETPSQTASSSYTPSISPSSSITSTVTSSETTSPSQTPSNSESSSITSTITTTATVTKTVTASQTITPSETLTATITPTMTPNYTPPKSPSPSRSITPTRSITLSATPTISQSESVGFWDQEPSVTATATSSLSPSGSGSISPSTSASNSVSPSTSQSGSSSVSPSRSQSGSGSVSPSTSASNSVSPSTSQSSSSSVSPSRSVSSSGSVSPSQTSSSSVSPSRSVSSSGSVSPSRSVSSSGSVSPSQTSSSSVSPSRSQSVSSSVSPSQTSSSSVSPSQTSSSSVSPSTSQSSSSSVSPSTSQSSSSSVSPSTSQSSSSSVSPSQTSSSSVSPSTSQSSSSSVSPSTSQSSSSSVSPSTSQTSSSSVTSTNTPSTSSSISGSQSSSSSVSPSRSSSVSPSRSQSSSHSITSTNTPSTSSSISGSQSKTPSKTTSTSPSQTETQTSSPSQTESPSVTTTASPTESFLLSPSLFTSLASFNFTQTPNPTPTTTSQAGAILQNLTDALNSPISPERFDNLLTSFGSAQDSVSESQAFSMLTNLVAALGTDNIDPTRGAAIIDILAGVQPSAETLASNTALLQNLAQGLSASLPVGQSLVLGDPSSGFALAVIKIDPKAEANLALSENSTLTIPPLGGLSAPLHFAASGIEQPTYSIGLSLNGTEITVANLSQPFVMGFPPLLNGPNASQVIQCEYYDPQTRSWQSDGCETNYDNVTKQTQCSCTHLTEFAARFKALADVQAGVGQGFVDLFTKTLSGKVIPILVFLIVMAGTSFVLIIFLNNLDKKAIGAYSKMLELLPQLQEIRKAIGLKGDYVWDRFLTKAFFSLPRGANVRKVLRERALPRGGIIKKILEFWWRRLFHQHFYTSLLVRYDPATPRVLRALFAMTGFFTSVAIVIFFYGYTNGSVNSQQLPAITATETFVLSLMSSALTTPIITVLRIFMTKAGEWEYNVRYPELMAEVSRRRMFERALAQLPNEEIIKQGRPLLEKIEALPVAGDVSSGSGSDSGSSSRSGSSSGSDRTKAKSKPKSIRSLSKPRLSNIVMTGTATDASQEVASAAASVFTALDQGRGNGNSATEALEVNFIFQAIRWLASYCSCGRRKADQESPSLQKIISQVVHRVPSKAAAKEPCLPYRFFPVHTGKSWILVGSMLGWTAFTMIYILAFTSYESSDVAADVIRTVAISQAISNGVVAPITQLSSIVIPYVLTTIKNALKKPVAKQTFGSPLVASLDSALSVRLPALASKHPCCSGDKKVDITLLPVSEIVDWLSNTPPAEINTTAMAIVRNLYISIFYIKLKKPTIIHPEEIKIDAGSFTEERAYKDL